LLYFYLNTELNYITASYYKGDCKVEPVLCNPAEPKLEIAKSSQVTMLSVALPLSLKLSRLTDIIKYIILHKRKKMSKTVMACASL